MDRLLDSADALLWRLADSAQRPSAGAARRAVAALRTMAKDYEAVTADPAAAAAVEESAGELAALLGAAADSDALPDAARGLVYSLRKDSLHRLAQLMAQRALEAPGPKGPIGANILLTVPRALAPALEFPALDVGDGAKGLFSAPLRAVADILSGESGAGGASAVFGRRRVWLGLAGARITAYPAAAQAGGVVRVAYREEGASAAEQGRFYFLSKALFEAGFAVSVSKGELLASLDGTCSRLDAAGMEERFVFAARAASAARSLTGRLDALLAGVSQAENAARLDFLARLLAAEGELSLPSGPKAFARALAEQRGREGERERLRLRMNKTLAALHLPEFPAVPVGRRTLELHFNGPIDAALARGELRLENGRPVRARGYDPLSRLAALAARDAGGGAPPRVEPLASGSEPIGLVAGRRAERGQWRLDRERWIVLTRLRGPSGPALFELVSRGGKPKSLSTGEALSLMDQAGLLRPPEEGAAAPAPSSRRPRAPSSAAAWGRVLAPGPAVSAPLTYSRAQAILGGRIYATPYAAGADEDALRRVKGLLSTQGAPQSALLAAAANVPALELSRAEWSESAGLRVEEPIFGPPRKAAGVEVRDPAGVRRYSIREGDAARLDAQEGLVEFPEPDKQDLRLRPAGLPARE